MMWSKMRRNKKKIKPSKSGPWKQRNFRRRKNPPSNTILLFVLFVLFYAAYQYQESGISFATLTEKPTQTDTPAASKPRGKILEGRITHVRDGDTFEVNGIPVRISALDCPENSTSAGKAVTRFAKKFKGKIAVCELTGAKTYDRVVGYCSIGGKDFGKTMMDQTSCKLWAKYDVWNRY
jgi:endonuclease YncB( thermonuclease family)